MTKVILSLLILAALTTTLVVSAQASLLFDNISNYQNSVPGATVSSTTSTPNTFMGDGYTLASGTTSLTGFDIYPDNLSGTSYTGLKLNMFVWGSVNTGTVNSGAPAFGNLLGSYSFTRTGAFNTGFYYPYEGSPVGSAPGYTLPTPLTLSGTTIGVTFNYQGTTDGITYNSANSLTSLISYGTAPTVGTQVFNGYYRNAASETDGNFTSSLRSLGYTNQSLALRIYGNGAAAVPEPSTYILLTIALGAVGFVRGKMHRHA